MSAQPPLIVEKVAAADQFCISNIHLPLEDFDREYVNFSGYSGLYSPTLFAEAPAMLEALRVLLKFADGVIERAGLVDTNGITDETRAILARIDGGAA